MVSWLAALVDRVPAHMVDDAGIYHIRVRLMRGFVGRRNNQSTSPNRPASVNALSFVGRPFLAGHSLCSTLEPHRLVPLGSP